MTHPARQTRARKMRALLESCATMGIPTWLHRIGERYVRCPGVAATRVADVSAGKSSRILAAPSARPIVLGQSTAVAECDSVLLSA